MRKVAYTASLFMLLGLILSLTPGQSYAQEEITCETDVTVQADDWLSKLADKFYGDPLAFPAIAEATNQKAATDDSYADIANVDIIEVGWKLCIPSGADAEALLGSPIATGETSGAQFGGEASTFASSDPGTLDPAAIASYDQGLIAPNLLEGLFRLSPDGRTIENGLAESFEVSADGTVWTFNLRPNAVFHNGDPVTADAVKFSFERVLNPDLASPRAWMLESVAGAEAFQAGEADAVSGIEVVDDSTVQITLSRPLAFFRAILANPSLAIVSPRAVEELGEDFGQNVVSAGPFMLAEWNLNQDIKLVAFEDYWAGRPYLDSLVYRVISDENTRILEFDAGTLDVTWVPPAYWDRFSTDPVFKDELGWAETFHTDFIAINLEQEPFGTNLALRQAICHAVDREAAITSLQGRASNAQGILPPGLLGYDENASLCDYDPEQARELLAEAGFADGVPGEFKLLMPPWGNLVKLMEIYQANLKEVGINITLNPTEFGPYLEALDSGQYDLAWIYKVADYADPDSFYNTLLHSSNIGGGGNVARYKNDQVDQAIETGRRSIAEADRLAAYEQVDQLYSSDLPYIPLTHNIYVDVHQPWIENYVPSPMDTHMYHRVWISQDTK